MDDTEKEVIRKPSAALVSLKWVLALILLAVGGLIGAYAYLTGNSYERDSFETQYYQTIELLERRIVDSLESKVKAGTALSQLFVDRQWFPSRSVSFPSFERFDEAVRDLLPLALARSMSWNPFISTMEERAAVEAWAKDLVLTLPLNRTKLFGPAYNGTRDSWSASSLAYAVDKFGVYRRVNVTVQFTSPPVPSSPSSNAPYPPSYNLNYYVPVFYIAPLEDPVGGDNYAAVLFDLNSEAERRAAFSRAIDANNCSTTGLIYLVQDTRIGLFRAAGITFCPVTVNGELYGFTSTVFNWYKMFENAVPTFIQGLKIVLEARNATGSPVYHTFLVNGRTVQDLGRGAQYDGEHKGYRRSFSVSQGLDFTVTCFPTTNLRDQYYTTEPRDRCIIVVAFVVSAVGVFLLYDYIARSQSLMLASLVKAASKLVDDIFPKNVKHRVVKAHLGGTTGDDSFTNPDASKPAKSVVDILKSGTRNLPLKLSKGSGAQPTSPQGGPAHQGPAIADYYPNATVLFSEIAGFTAWASSVQPETVFQLLETMFYEFDSLASRLKVFKVETIGDTYMAVTGCPETDEHHAIHMADFALGMVEAMERIKKQSGVHHLQIRIGLNSGPVVAGVIRSAKMRFQLFGDTVNSASRMQSTGAPGLIQVSQSTAELLQAYRQHVLEERGMVEAKGKGQVLAYWLKGRVEGTDPLWYEPQESQSLVSLVPERSGNSNKSRSLSSFLSTHR